MNGNATLFRLDGGRLAGSLQEAAAASLESGELVLDFSAVARIDAASVRALASMIDVAAERQLKLSAHAVPVDVYKVLKLAGLASRITFLS